MPFAAVRQSAFGTKRTCRDNLPFVRFRGEADIHDRVASTSSLVVDESRRPRPRAQGIEIPQLSGLPYRDVLSLKWKQRDCCLLADLPRNACLDTRENGMTRICFILLSVLGLAFASGATWAQAWPTRPIRAIVADAWPGADGHAPGRVRCACQSRDSRQRSPHQRGRNQINQSSRSLS